MLDEEERAIEKLNYINMAYDCNNHYSKYELDCIDKVLNLVQKQENELERLQKENELAKEALKDKCKIADERNQLLTENEELKYKYKRALSDLVEAEKKTEDSISKEAIRNIANHVEYYLIGNLKYQDSQKQFEYLLKNLKKLLGE